MRGQGRSSPALELAPPTVRPPSIGPEPARARKAGQTSRMEARWAASEGRRRAVHSGGGMARGGCAQAGAGDACDASCRTG